MKALFFILALLSVLSCAFAAPRLSLESLLGEEESDGFHQFLPTENLDIFGLVESDVFNLALLTRLCSHEVDALFGDHRSPEHRLNFFAMDVSFAESNFKNWDIPLRSADPLEVSVVRILHGLLLRQLRERLGINVRKADAPPSIQFLAAALANRIVNDGKGTKGRYRKDYRIPRRQLAVGHCPDLARLLTEVPPPQSRLLFRIYLVHCDLLLTCLESDRNHRLPQILTQWWQLECREQLSTTDALARLLGVTPARLQEWYEAQFSAQTRSNKFGEPSEDIASQLKNLLTISVVDLGGADQVKTVQLEDLPKLLKNRPPDVFTLSGVQTDLMQLRIVASPIFQETLDQYIASVDALRHNDIKLFRKRYKLAQKQFQQALKLQGRVSKLLDEVERDLSPMDALRTAAWNTILEHREKLRRPMDRVLGLESM